MYILASDLIYCNSLYSLMSFVYNHLNVYYHPYGAYTGVCFCNTPSHDIVETTEVLLLYFFVTILVWLFGAC